MSNNNKINCTVTHVLYKKKEMLVAKKRDIEKNIFKN